MFKKYCPDCGKKVDAYPCFWCGEDIPSEHYCSGGYWVLPKRKHRCEVIRDIERRWALSG